MLYVALLDWQHGLTREQRDGALARRAGWSYPDGITPHGEYWPAAGAPAVIFVFEAEAFEPIFEIELTWSDVFDVRILPATTPEAGLPMGAAILERRAMSTAHA